MPSRILKAAASRIAIVFFLLFLPCNVFAQAQFFEVEEEADSDEIAQEDGEEKKGSVEDSWQILEWEESDPKSVLYYDVVIETLNKKNGQYIPLMQTRTEGNETKLKIQPRLPIGQYRYKIITYNLIEIASAESEFFEFSIIRAYKPKITDISSNVTGNSTIYIEEPNDGVFDISGRNLFETDQDSLTHTEYILKSKGGREIQPEILSHEKSNRGLRVKFDMESIDTGVYNFVAIDASGLESDSSKNSQITVKFRKWYDIDLSAGYACPIVIYNDTISKYMDSSVWPIGINAKGVFIFSKHNFGYLGAGLNMHYNRLSYDAGIYTVEGNIIDIYADFVFQKLFYAKPAENQNRGRHFLTVEFRAGAGFLLFEGFVFKFPGGGKGEALNGIYFAMQAGGSAQYFITNRFFVEAGFDYVHAFAGDIMLGEIIPCLSAGWQF